jgi:hypothetical protein
MQIQRFQARVEKSGSKTIIVIPFNPNEAWGEKKRHHITGSINGKKFRGPLGSEGTQYFLSLGAAWLREVGMEAGQQVEVELAPEGPQQEALAPDIAAALELDNQARAFFEALATFYRKGYLRWIEGARRPEARQARIMEMVDLLKAGKKQR